MNHRTNMGPWLKTILMAAVLCATPALAALAAPVVVTPANGAFVNTPTPTIRGTAPANSTVYVFINASPVGSTPADASGNWSFTLPQALSDGMHQVQASGQPGFAGPFSNANTFTVKTVPPGPPVVVTPADGVSLMNPSPTFSGTADPGCTVTVSIDGVAAGTTTADASGNWSFNAPTALALGPHTVSAQATDPASNTGPASAVNHFTVVQPVPHTTITSGPQGPTSSVDATFEFSSDVPGATFECSLDGAGFTDCSSPLNLTRLQDGPHTLLVRAKNAQGLVDPDPARQDWTIGTEHYLGGDGVGVGCTAMGGEPTLALLGLAGLLTRAGRRRRR